MRRRICSGFVHTLVPDSKARVLMGTYVGVRFYSFETLTAECEFKNFRGGGS
jgi:hypothetical protein